MRYNLLAISGDPRLNERLQAALGADCAILIADPRMEDQDGVAKRFDPSAIILDANLHGGTRTVLERIAAVRARFAGTPLIVIGDEMSAQLILSAFRAGANDFIDRDASDAEIRTLLLSALRDNAARSGGNAAATQIGILSAAPADEDHDLALNIASLLAANAGDRRILFLDMSLPASPAGPALGLELGFTVHAAIRDIARLDKTFLDSALARAPDTGLYVLPLADGPADAANLPALRDVSVLLQILSSLFDTVVAYWGAFSRQAALTGPQDDSRHLLLCCNQRFSSIRNAKAFLTELGAGTTTQKPILAIHQFDPAIAPQAQDIIRATGASRSLVLNASWAALAQAQNRGRPLSLAGPSAYGDALRGYLAQNGLLTQDAAAQSGTVNLLRWLRKARG